MATIKELSASGQSVWLDYIRRSFLTSGGLRELVEEGLGGVTSNPSIFEKAIAGSSDYDDVIATVINKNLSIQTIYETLAIKDIQMAADDLRSVYDSTEGRDGFVSLEVNPTLAYETQKTIHEAKRLYEAVGRPNVMIKVPATSAGIPAISELIGAGLNINITLIFSLENYRLVANAYLEGLEKLARTGPTVKGGQKIDRVASVASFFVSRVDSAVDSQLKALGNQDLLGKIAIANARLAYRMFQEIFDGIRWTNLSAKGARVQRPLWASTSTKNPELPDTIYVDQLIGPHTVNTVPPATLDAFRDHGNVSQTLTKNVDEALAQFEQMQNLGIDIDAITDKLQEDGVTAFAKSFESLMDSLKDKLKNMHNLQPPWRTLGTYQATVDASLKSLKEDRVVSRMWAHDHTIWKNEPTEISNRLGWLHSPDTMSETSSEIEAFVDAVRSEGYSHALLLGMGGSSLAPEVFRETFGVRNGYLDLAVLDSTDPTAVQEMDARLDPSTTLYIVSTKSGGTVETLSFMKFFYNRCLDAVGAETVGQHFVAITDPGSALEEMAKNYHFRKVFLNDPNIGGRYSALSYFGLVPAALIGVDLTTLLERAGIAVDMSRHEKNSKDNIPVALGVVMGELAKAGRDKLTLVMPDKIRAFGGWLEQLIAESTGKEGKGVLPVDGEALAIPSTYRNDRVFVHLSVNGEDHHSAALTALQEAGHPVIRFDLRDLYDLGKEFFRWEVATAVCGRVLSINPFDQPNVESAKKSARSALDAYRESGRLKTDMPSFREDNIAVYNVLSAQETAAKSLTAFVDTYLQADAVPYSYVAIQAYLTPSRETDEALNALRSYLLRRYRLATTVGYGPRFLHSTGQLHKGDAGNGLFIQLTGEVEEDLSIPDQPGIDFSVFSFGVLIQSQAIGDRQALMDENRKVIRFHLSGNLPAAIRKLIGDPGDA